jgi:hypothetical protein
MTVALSGMDSIQKTEQSVLLYAIVQCDCACTYALTVKIVVAIAGTRAGCALTFASEAKFEIEAKLLFRLEAKKKKPDFT